ncbi:MAG TPA: hypothetical protein VK705_00405, partial [Ferruginibacter sp.]|nr:hypothetical protein [Ferruginibacter sp.]
MSSNLKNFKSTGVIFIALFIISLKAFSQDDSLHTVNQKIAESHCNPGTGNGTFKITLSQLEAILSDKYTQKTLLRLLPKHLCQFKLSFNGNVKTGEFDIPNFEFTYAFTDKNFNLTGVVITITIEGNI